MFTGIITDLGAVRAVEKDGDVRFAFDTGYDSDEIPIGASIACSGVCLTVVDKGPGWFAVQASAETLARTTLGAWRPGRAVNFERALTLGAELGGHFVFGHVDAVATIADRAAEGDSLRLLVEAPEPLMKFVAPKGCAALDGVSLTVNEVEGTRFGVNVIPYTQKSTTLGAVQPGDRVNLEVDMLARYVDRLLQVRMGE
jgi:riboflavin synthase